jgi:hypothetical protein
MAKGPEAVDFFDEDDEQHPPGNRGSESVAYAGGSGPSTGPPTRQQARVRQAVFLIGAILILILIVIAFRGCLNARKDRAFENYVSDLSAITVETQQLSDNFFKRLNGDSTIDETTFGQEVDGDLGTSQGLLNRAQGLDAPGAVEGAQNQIELSFELRHDALEGISSLLGQLTGNDAKSASKGIYTQMKVLSASDILYARAQDEIEQALTDEGVVVEDGVPDSQFLPDEPDYLDPTVTAGAFAGVADESGAGISGGGANCDPGDNKIHGLQLISASALPSGVALDPAATVTASGDDEIDVEVLNGGDTEENNITVTVSGDGGISGSERIASIASQEQQTVAIPLGSTPKAGQTVNIDVEVSSVCGETLTDNNAATYSVTF